MQYFTSFRKKQGIFVEPANYPQELGMKVVAQLNADLAALGYILSKEATEALSKQTPTVIEDVYNQLIWNIRDIIPNGDTFIPLFPQFPLNERTFNVDEFVEKSKEYYETSIWDSTFLKNISDKHNIDLSSAKEISLLSKQEYEDIFANIAYSSSSISGQDTQALRKAIQEGFQIDLSKVRFNEILATIGEVYLDLGLPMPTKDANSILRIWSAYSDGDPGLKELVRFKRPTVKQRKILLAALNDSYNLEESFKLYRERWLRLLFYLNPMTKKNKAKYPVLYKYVYKLRNTPKELRTFNSYVEEGLTNKDPKVLDLLVKRMGVFTRKLDHTVRLFGTKAFDAWLANKPNTQQLITVYNHFYNRDKEQNRSSILANSSKSVMVNYKELKPLPKKVVTYIRDTAVEELRNRLNGKLGKIYIDPVLYTRALASNERAASESLIGTNSGQVIQVSDNAAVLRLYCMWEGFSDIDFSSWVYNKYDLVKVGYNGITNYSNSVKYSGDNTGMFSKNAEYIDINLKSLPKSVEWIITEARIYSGKTTFADYQGNAYSGMMERDRVYATTKWVPEDLTNAIKLTASTDNLFTQAYHVRSNKVVLLDMSINASSNVSSEGDILSVIPYLNNLITGSPADMDQIKLGHILKLAATEVVDDPKKADIVYAGNTLQEEVEKLF